MKLISKFIVFCCLPILLNGCLISPNLRSGVPANKQCYLFPMPGFIRHDKICTDLTAKAQCQAKSQCVWLELDPWGQQDANYPQCRSKEISKCEVTAAKLGCLSIVALRASPEAVPLGAVYSPCPVSDGAWTRRISKAPGYEIISGPGQ